MLKLKDKTGKTVGVLKDDGDVPEMVAEPGKKKCKEKGALANPEEEVTEETKQGEDDADVC